MIQACGLLETPYNFFVDHLAPLCSLLNIPMISSKVHTKLLYQKYYPDLNIQIKNWNIRELINNYTHVFYSFDPKPSFKELIKQAKIETKNQTQFIHHFHGCSDKGYRSRWVDPTGHIKDVDLLIIYGKRMEDLLRDKKLYNLPRSILSLGNYRYSYYLKYKAFFDKKVSDDIFCNIDQNRPTILYAPTWQDHENSSSFLMGAKTILNRLKKRFNVIVKLHPNQTLKTTNYDPQETLKLIESFASDENLFFLPFYPLIYPIVNQVDAYLGDFSSVGYDVLAFNKPMFFLNHLNKPIKSKGSYLYKTGTAINFDEFEKIDQIIDQALQSDQSNLTLLQNEVYQYAFGEVKDFDALKRPLLSAMEGLKRHA